MKVIISEEQLRLIIESEDKRKLFRVPVDFLINHTNAILNNYKKKGFDGIIVEGELDLSESDLNLIENLLDNIVKVEGYLSLQNSQITSLGKLEEVKGYLDLIKCTKLTDLGNLISVGALNLRFVPITSLGKLKEVRGTLYIEDCPLAKLSDEEIRSQVEIKRKIYRG